MPDVQPLQLLDLRRAAMRLRDRTVAISPGEFFIVPRGVEHQPVADGEIGNMVISGHRVTLPPLRQRPEDLAPLIQFFLDAIRRTTGSFVAGLDRKAIAALAGHAWPGNVRELENVIERAAILGKRAPRFEGRRRRGRGGRARATR